MSEFALPNTLVPCTRQSRRKEKITLAEDQHAPDLCNSKDVMLGHVIQASSPSCRSYFVEFAMSTFWQAEVEEKTEGGGAITGKLRMNR